MQKDKGKANTLHHLSKTIWKEITSLRESFTIFKIILPFSIMGKPVSITI